MRLRLINESIIDQTKLWYKKDASDKIYNIMIEKHSDKYLVKVEYGRRGKKINSIYKTAQPISLQEAQKIYKNIVNTQLRKGYDKVEDTNKIYDSGSGRGSNFYKASELGPNIYGYKIVSKDHSVNINDVIIPGFVVPISDDEVGFDKYKGQWYRSQLIRGSDHFEFYEDEHIIIKLKLPEDLNAVINDEIEVEEWGALGVFGKGTPVILTGNEDGYVESTQGGEAVVLSQSKVIDVYGHYIGKNASGSYVLSNYSNNIVIW